MKTTLFRPNLHEGSGFPTYNDEKRCSMEMMMMVVVVVIVMMMVLDCCDDDGYDCDRDDDGVRDCCGTILLFRWRSRLRGGGFVSRRDTNLIIFINQNRKHKIHTTSSSLYSIFVIVINIFFSCPLDLL